MTGIKLCGLSRECDIRWANEVMPEYIGFIFAKKSRRYVSPEQARSLKGILDPGIRAVGVFVNEEPEKIEVLVEAGIIDIVQLHGQESEEYIQGLRSRIRVPVVKAFRVQTMADIQAARNSSADWVLLDSGAGGTGSSFDWDLLSAMTRPFFLAGGLDPDNAAEAVTGWHPFAVDVSTGIETDGWKDRKKMMDFVRNVRKEEDR